MTNKSLLTLVLYLRATIRMTAVRLVRATTYPARFAETVECWILDGWPMRTIEMCVFHGVDIEWATSIGRRFA